MRGKGDSPASPYIAAGSRAASALLAAHLGTDTLGASDLRVAEGKRGSRCATAFVATVNSGPVIASFE